MYVSWRYRERDTVLQRFDPRSRIIFTICVLFSLVQFWDLRFILVFFVLGVVQLWSAQLTWAETKRFWSVLALVILTLSIFTSLTGGAGAAVYESYTPLRTGTLLFTGIPVAIAVSVEQVTFFVTQIVRLVTFGLFALPLPYTIHPARYGIAFRRLGVPDKFAFSTDLAFRFVPSLGQDFQMTLDAQRARGYEVERRGSGLISQIRNMVPLMIPFIVGSIVRSEALIDVLDMRGFGTRPRTWLEELRYERRDYLLLATSLLLLLISTVMNMLDVGKFRTPSNILVDTM